MHRSVIPKSLQRPKADSPDEGRQLAVCSTLHASGLEASHCVQQEHPPPFHTLTETPMTDASRHADSRALGAGLGIGIGVGTAIGVALGSIALGASAGAVVGVVIGALMRRRGRQA